MTLSNKVILERMAGYECRWNKLEHEWRLFHKGTDIRVDTISDLGINSVYQAEARFVERMLDRQDPEDEVAKYHRLIAQTDSVRQQQVREGVRIEDSRWSGRG